MYTVDAQSQVEKNISGVSRLLPNHSSQTSILNTLPHKISGVLCYCFGIKKNIPQIYSAPRLPFSFFSKKKTHFFPPCFFHVDLGALHVGSFFQSFRNSTWDQLPAPEPKRQYSYHHQLEPKCPLHAFDLEPTWSVGRKRPINGWTTSPNPRVSFHNWKWNVVGGVFDHFCFTGCFLIFPLFF